MIIDVHCHFTFTATPADPAIPRFSFEPAVEAGRPALDSWVAPRAVNRLAWKLLRRALHLPLRIPPGPELDAALWRAYERHFFADGPVERIVLLAFDDYHDASGRRPPPPQSRDDRGGDIYTSNSLVREYCRRYPQRLLFGASVHPYRPRAVECVEEVFRAGACLLKWLPLHQNIDIADPRTIAVLRKCAELRLPVLAHYGEEFTLATQHPDFLSPRAALDVLRQLRAEGVLPPFIFAHVATPVWALGDRRPWKLVTEALLGELADAPVYADISALATFGKMHFFPGLARQVELHGKLLFGTDFPIPPADPLLRWRYGRAYREIAAMPSWIQRTAAVCRHAGFSEIVMHRAGEVLANLR